MKSSAVNLILLLVINLKPIELFPGNYFISRGYPTPALLPSKQQRLQKKQAMLDLLVIKAAKKAASEKGIDRSRAYELVNEAIAHLEKYPNETMDTLTALKRELDKSDISPLTIRNQFLGLEPNTIGADHTFYFDEDDFVKFAEHSNRSLADLIEEKIDAAKLVFENLKLKTVNRDRTVPSGFSVPVGSNFASNLSDSYYTVVGVKDGLIEFDREINTDVHMVESDNWALGVKCDRDSLYKLIRKVDGISPIDEIYDFYLAEINGFVTEDGVADKVEKKISAISKKRSKTTS